MQTNLPNKLLATSSGQRANDILRKCVHCGFCNATCPTHQITGDELDGPRGRIYLIKEMLEGEQTTQSTMQHLDSCLTCLNCETTCPSGVKFGELAEIGKHILDDKNLRNRYGKFKRWIICKILPYPTRFTPFYLVAKWLKLSILPSQTLVKSVTTNAQVDKKVILLKGCVQSVAMPNINSKLESLLNQLNIGVFTHPQVDCCNAIHHHNGMPEQALENIKKTIDQWWPLVESGYEEIIMTASGCGSMVKDYGRLLQHDSNYAEKARVISAMTKDASEFLSAYPMQKTKEESATIAFHPPCTLQHNQKITGVVEKILANAGYKVTNFKDKHLCCGSAGTYSILQADMAKQLRDNKIKHIHTSQPDIIATANIGCLLHLQQGTSTPVKHWLDLITC